MSNWNDEPDSVAMMKRISAAFTAMREAQKKLNRVKKPEAIEAARKAAIEADTAYRQASNERDEFFSIRKAQRTQGRVGPITLTGKLFPFGPERDE